MGGEGGGKTRKGNIEPKKIGEGEKEGGSLLRNAVTLDRW